MAAAAVLAHGILVSRSLRPGRVYTRMSLRLGLAIFRERNIGVRRSRVERDRGRRFKHGRIAVRQVRRGTGHGHKLRLTGLAAIVDDKGLRLVHLVINVPHRADRDECCDTEDSVLNDLVPCAAVSILGLLQRNSEINGDELLRKRENGSNRERDHTHTARGEHRSGDFEHLCQPN